MDMVLVTICRICVADVRMVGVTMAVAIDDSFTVDIDFAFDFVVIWADEWFAAGQWPVVGRIAIGFLIVDFGVDRRSVTSLTRPLRRTGDVRLKDAYAVDFEVIAVATALFVVLAAMVGIPGDSTVCNLTDFLLMFELCVTDWEAFAV